MPQNKIRKVIVMAQVKGDKALRSLNAQFGRLNKTVKTMNSSFGTLKLAFAGYFSIRSISAITRAADSFQLLSDRIKVFTGSQEEAAAVFEDLIMLARFTRTSTESLAISYNRIALATQELGLTQEQLLATTLALQQTFRLSGATIAEATAATIQLSQGLSSGQLRGQELRSVLEQNAVFANLLAQELGIARGQLIKFAEQGKITSDIVLNTLGKNINKLNEDASKLGTTFEQSFTIVLDVARTVINTINRRYNLSNIIGKWAVSISKNVDSILDVLDKFLGAIGFVWDASIELLKALRLIGDQSLLSAITKIIKGIISLIFDWRLNLLKLERVWITVKIGFLEGLLAVENGVRKLLNILTKLTGSTDLWDMFTDPAIGEAQTKLDAINKSIAELSAPPPSAGGKNRIKEITKSLNTTFTIVQKGAGNFAALNAQIIEGTIALDDYVTAISRIQQEELNKKFREGKIALSDYYEALIKIEGATDKITNKSPLELGIVVGVERAIKSIGTLADNIAKGVNKVIGTLEDSLLDFVKTGKFSFKEFAQVVVDELTRIAIRLAIIKPLLSSFGVTGQAAPGGVSAAATTTPNALGNAFQGGNVIPFARGGVVNGPTLFPMKNGTGLMGEAGPEAVMPLGRDTQGRLGVRSSGGNMTVNIINNASGVETETRESTGISGEKQLDVVIVNKVSQAIGEGRLDRTFNEVYGLNRRGS